MQATRAVWGELLGQVEHGVWQPLLQCLGILLGVVLPQAPGGLLVVTASLRSAAAPGSLGNGAAVPSRDPRARVGIYLGRGLSHWKRTRLWSQVREGSF